MNINKPRDNTILFAVGISMIVLSVIFFVQYLTAKDSYVACQAILVEVQESDDGKKSYIVEYEYAGEKYRNPLPYSPSASVGDTLTVRIDPADPSEFLNDGFWLFSWAFLILGVILCGIYTAFALYRRKKRLIKEALVETGLHVITEIDIIRCHADRKANGVHPFTLVCKPVEGQDSPLEEIESEFLWFDPAPVLKQYKITRMDAYIDRENHGFYYMPLKHVIEAFQDMKYASRRRRRGDQQ